MTVGMISFLSTRWSESQYDCVDPSLPQRWWSAVPMLFSLLAESQQPTVPLSWEDLMRQLPLLAVAPIVAWYSFRHITQQHEDHLNDIRKQTEKTLEMLADASA